MNTNIENDFNVAFGNRLMVSRLSKGMSQEQLGAMIGVRAQQIHKYETGENRMSLYNAYRCAQILGITVSYLYGEMEGVDRPRYNQTILTIAAQIDSLPNDELRKGFYLLARAVSKITDEDAEDNAERVA